MRLPQRSTWKRDSVRKEAPYEARTGSDYPTAFDGSVDEFIIIREALSEDDISDIMSRGIERALLGKTVKPKSKLAATWAEIKNQ